jgi:alpha-L-fucosidase
LKIIYTVLIIILPSFILYSQSVESIQQQFIDLRFGAFFHFGIRTFTGRKWGEAEQDTSQFNPIHLDCEQWTDALVSAKMKFGTII